VCGILWCVGGAVRKRRGPKGFITWEGEGGAWVSKRIDELRKI